LESVAFGSARDGDADAGEMAAISTGFAGLGEAAGVQAAALAPIPRATSEAAIRGFEGMEIPARFFGICSRFYTKSEEPSEEGS